MFDAVVLRGGQLHLHLFIACCAGRCKNEHQYLKNKNYLYCDHTEPGFFMLTAARRWQIALLIAEEKITEVYVSYGLIGP